MSRIDREAVVRRHDVHLYSPDPAHVLTVGNGDFAYTADITGLQTFPSYHDQVSAHRAGRRAVDTATLSSWGWHEMPNPEGYELGDALTDYPSSRGPVSYPDRFDLSALGGGEVPPDMRAGTWLHLNPQRMDLGRIGLILRPTPDGSAETDPAVLTDVHQHLDLFSGEIVSEFSYAGQRVRVQTVADPVRAQVGFRIESGLIAQGLLAVSVRFGYPVAGFFQTVDWGRPERHRTQASGLASATGRFRRILDGSAHVMQVASSAGFLAAASEDPHRFELAMGHPGQGPSALEVVATWAPEDTELEPGTFGGLRAAAANWWRQFWTSGAAIELSGHPDARELERRIVLSQYLTAVNCAGSVPPQETGLVTNSWSGKFHLEMHFWHAAHFALWGRGHLLERSLPWYRSALPMAQETAHRQGYAGARWPKQVGPEGRESPGTIGPLLIWQQPHLLYLLELLYRGHSQKTGFLAQNAEMVEETATFMASFADERDGVYHLGSPVMPAQEFYDARTSQDPTFELAYWWWGLEIAQRWRERRGLDRDKAWQAVQDGLARPHLSDGHYDAIATEPYLRRDDHPAMLCALGLVPAGPVIDPAVMAATLEEVSTTWDWDSAWGWDFPVMAMTATRLRRPDLAVAALLSDRPKNQFDVTGHNPQMGSILPIYLPGNGSLLSAVALMAAGWDEHPASGFPDDGAWDVTTEGFLPWP